MSTDANIRSLILNLRADPESVCSSPMARDLLKALTAEMEKYDLKPNEYLVTSTGELGSSIVYKFKRPLNVEVKGKCLHVAKITDVWDEEYPVRNQEEADRLIRAAFDKFAGYEVEELSRSEKTLWNFICEHMED